MLTGETGISPHIGGKPDERFGTMTGHMGSGRTIGNKPGPAIMGVWDLRQGDMGGESGFAKAQDWDDLARQANQPSLLILADQPWFVSPVAHVADLATALGFRILDQVPIGAAADRLTRVVDVDAVLVRCSGAEPGLDLLLARLDTMAGNQGMSLVVAVDFDGLDHVHAIVDADHAVILCRPQYEDVVAALAGSAGRPHDRERLHDIGRGENADPRLDRLSDELGRLSRTIEALVQNRGPSQFLPSRPDEGEEISLHSPRRSYSAMPVVETARGTAVTAQQVRAVLRVRRLREQLLPADLFADPAWDILLDLMAARLENAKVSVSSLCIAAVVPPTTALRWIRQLTERELLERRADPDDGRRIFITLSDKGVVAVTRWFEESYGHMLIAAGHMAGDKGGARSSF